MQDMNHFYQQNYSYVVYPVWNWQWGLFADGKYCIVNTETPIGKLQR